MKGYVERKPIPALSGDKETVMDLRRGAERDGGRPILVANLLASQSTNPGTLSSRTGSKGGDSDLGDPPQLQAEVASFLQCSSETAEEDSKGISPEPPISQCY